MKKIFADTNLFIRYFIRDIEPQVDQIKILLKKAKSKKIILVVLPEILFEIDFVLRSNYQVNKKERVEYLTSLAKSNYIHVPTRQTVIETFSLYKKHNVDIIDCWLYAMASYEKGDIASFDSDFKKLTK